MMPVRLCISRYASSLGPLRPYRRLARPFTCYMCVIALFSWDPAPLDPRAQNRRRQLGCSRPPAPRLAPRSFPPLQAPLRAHLTFWSGAPLHPARGGGPGSGLGWDHSASEVCASISRPLANAGRLLRHGTLAALARPVLCCVLCSPLNMSTLCIMSVVKFRYNQHTHLPGLYRARPCIRRSEPRPSRRPPACMMPVRLCISRYASSLGPLRPYRRLARPFTCYMCVIALFSWDPAPLDPRAQNRRRQLGCSRPPAPRLAPRSFPPLQAPLRAHLTFWSGAPLHPARGGGPGSGLGFAADARRAAPGLAGLVAARPTDCAYCNPRLGTCACAGRRRVGQCSPPTLHLLPTLLEYLRRRRHTFWSTCTADVIPSGVPGLPTLPLLGRSHRRHCRHRDPRGTWMTFAADVTPSGAPGLPTPPLLGRSHRRHRDPRGTWMTFAAEVHVSSLPSPPLPPAMSILRRRHLRRVGCWNRRTRPPERALAQGGGGTTFSRSRNRRQPPTLTHPYPVPKCARPGAPGPQGLASHPFRSSPWAVVLPRQGQDVCPLPAAGMPPVPGSKQTTADRPPQLASTRKGGSTLCHVVPSETTRMAAMLTSTVRVNPAGALGAFSPPSPPSCSSSGTATTGDGTRRRDGVGSSSGGGSSIGGSGSSSSSSSSSRSDRCSRFSSCRGGRVLSHFIPTPFPPTSPPTCTWPPPPPGRPIFALPGLTFVRRVP